MKKLIYVILMMCVAVSAKCDVASFGTPKKWNDGWLFLLGDDSLASNPACVDTLWRKVSLPHDWSVEGQLSPTLASCTGYLPGGIGWYRKTFEVPDSAAKHYVYFEGVYNRSDVYINGHKLGHRPNGYVSFMYDLTPYLLPGKNVLAVRVDHSRYADSRWYTGSGIYRDVYLISAPEAHLAQWGVGYEATKVTGNSAKILVKANAEEAAKGMTIAAKILDAEGQEVARGSKKFDGDEVAISLNVKRPHLWNLNDPYLYTLVVDLLDGGKTIDSDTERIGIRTLAFDPNKGFALNGRNMKVKGVCIHHDAGTLGAAVPRDVWKRRLVNLKDMGANAIRMSHNPQAPVVYDLCDELGLLVMDEVSDEWEFPKRKWISGWNNGTPGFDGTYDFFEEWIETDITDMVRRDRNHPCIFMWSIGNEVDYPNDPYSHPVLDGSSINQPMFGGYNPDAPAAERIGKIAKRLAKCVKNVDTSRPTTGALAGVVMSNQTEYPQAVDVVGYNYTENRYAEDHATYPDRVIYGSENGVGYEAWRAVADNDYIFGQFIWTGIDYLGESGRWPSRGLNTGLLNFGGFKKPRGHFRASLWSEKPVTYVGAYPIGRVGDERRMEWVSQDAPAIWNYDDSTMMRVVCYTNAPFAKLLLNGEEIGEMKPYDQSNGIIYWDMSYVPGELKAVGCDDNGNSLSESVMRTSGRPYALRARLDGEYTAADGGVNHVLVEVVDEDGNVVTLADNDIACRVQGNAHLLGLEGSCNTDMSDYTDSRHRAYQGQLLAYVRNGAGDADNGNRRRGNRGWHGNRPGGDNGSGNSDPSAPVVITFTSPLLQPCSLTLAPAPAK